jgi:glycosyltransferase 2 family protein
LLRSRRFWLGTVVSLIFIALLLWRTDLREVWNAWRRADPRWLAAAIALYFASVQMRAFRYHFILLSRISISSWELFPILAIGYMANNLLPARAGELVRAYVLGERHNVSKMFSLGTVAVERLFDGLTLLGILICSGIFLGVNGVLRDLAIVTAPLFALALIIFLAVLASPSASETIAKRLVRMAPARFHERAEGLAIAFISGLGSLRHPRLFAIVIVTSALSWLMEGLVFALVGRALGISLPLGFFIMASAAANLAITAPSSQGGIGPYEFFAAQTLVYAGIGASVSAAFALAAHALVILPVTLAGLFFLWRINLSLGQAVRREQAAPLLDEPVTIPE